MAAPSTDSRPDSQGNLPGMYAGGRWVEAHGSLSLEIINPATEALLGRAPICSDEDVDYAVAAASTALPAWRNSGAGVRAEVMIRLADELRSRAAELGRAVTLENGSPIQETVGTVLNAATIISFYASLATGYDDRDVRPAANGLSSVVRRQALGVAG